MCETEVTGLQTAVEVYVITQKNTRNALIMLCQNSRS